MQQVTLFVLKYCGYCRRARQLLDEVLAAEEVLRSVPLRIIDEGEERELAQQYDYYYVPTFYIGDRKVHEGPVNREQISNIFHEALEQT
ncbi:MAG: thioredoxin [Ruminococcaceae bacterium]|jgi:glutaredoxin|nr:thioredoxin [Oscillospiraceae bacterium]